MINFAENLNKMITAGLGGDMEAPKTEVAVGYRVVNLDASGPVAEFETNLVTPLKRLLVTMEPMQSGDADPSPRNILPITGRESVTVMRAGKNLINQSDIASTSEVISVTVSVIPGKTYTLSAVCSPESQQSRVCISYVLDDETQWIFGNSIAAPLSGVSSATLTIPDVITEITLGFQPLNGGRSAYSNIQLELGSTATPYDPYKGQTVTIQLGQTVYGGTLDALTGKLTIYRVFFELQTADSSAWGKSTTYDGSFYIARSAFAVDGIPIKASSVLLCSHAKTVRSNNEYVYGTCRCSIYLNFFLMPSGSTVSDWLEYLWQQKDGGTPVEACGFLETPITVQLTPIQIMTLIGENTVSSDAGDVSVSYLYYEETEGY